MNKDLGNMGVIFTLLAAFAGCEPSKVSIPASSVDSIRLVNVHDFSSYEQRLITNQDTITAICRLFEEAQLVHNRDNVNTKLSYSLCDIYVYTRDEGKKHLFYQTTGGEGDLLWYAGSRFRSDSLLYWLR